MRACSASNPWTHPSISSKPGSSDGADDVDGVSVVMRVLPPLLCCTRSCQHICCCRGKRAPYVLGQAIRGAYPDLFAMYPDAYRRDDEALRNFIRANIRDSEGVLSRIVATFKAICDLAKFDQPDAEEEVASFSSNGSSNGAGKDTSSGSTIPISAMPSQSKDGTLTLNINIELHLPATQEADVYDKLFASLKRHLLEK